MPEPESRVAVLVVRLWTEIGDPLVRARITVSSDIRFAETVVTVTADVTEIHRAFNDLLASFGPSPDAVR